MSETGVSGAARTLYDNAALRRGLAALPVWGYDAGATVLAEGAKTGRLLPPVGIFVSLVARRGVRAGGGLMPKPRVCLALTILVSIGLLGQPAAARVGDKCGGVGTPRCGAGEFCEHPPNTCLVADAQGICASRPEVCAQIYAPVCGCDGKTYGNDCERRIAGVSKAHDGKCP